MTTESDTPLCVICGEPTRETFLAVCALPSCAIALEEEIDIMLAMLNEIAPADDGEDQ